MGRLLALWVLASQLAACSVITDLDRFHAADAGQAPPDADAEPEPDASGDAG